jgi:hypothetical protein
MKTHAILTAVILVGMAALSHAATIASPPLLSGQVADAAACYVRNVGPKPVTLQVKIVNAADDLQPASLNTCNPSPLAPGVTCVVLAPSLSTTNTAFSCIAVASGSKRNLRGTMELRDSSASGLTVLIAADLR